MGCDTRQYAGITKYKVGVIMDALKGEGATITGNNPWDVDTHKSGVKLRGEWNEATQTLAVTPYDKDFYVPCSKIWESVEPKIQEVQAKAEPAGASGSDAAGTTAKSGVGVTNFKPGAGIDRPVLDLRNLAKQGSAAPVAQAPASKLPLFIGLGILAAGIGWFALKKH